MASAWSLRRSCQAAISASRGFAVADAAAPRGPTTRIASLKNKASIRPSCMSMPTCSTSRPPKPTGNVTSALLHLRSIRWSLPSNATASSHDSPRRQKHRHPRPTLRTADPRIAPVKTVLTTVQSYWLPYRSSGPLVTVVALGLLYSFSVCGMQPMLLAIEMIADHRDACSCSKSTTSRTEHHGFQAKLFTVLLVIAPPSQVGASDKPRAVQGRYPECPHGSGFRAWLARQTALCPRGSERRRRQGSCGRYRVVCFSPLANACLRGVHERDCPRECDSRGSYRQVVLGRTPQHGDRRLRHRHERQRRHAR